MKTIGAPAPRASHRRLSRAPARIARGARGAQRARACSAYGWAHRRNLAGCGVGAAGASSARSSPASACRSGSRAVLADNPGDDRADRQPVASLGAQAAQHAARRRLDLSRGLASNFISNNGWPSRTRSPSAASQRLSLPIGFNATRKMTSTAIDAPLAAGFTDIARAPRQSAPSDHDLRRGGPVEDQPMGDWRIEIIECLAFGDKRAYSEDGRPPAAMARASRRIAGRCGNSPGTVAVECFPMLISCAYCWIIGQKIVRPAKTWRTRRRETGRTK